MVWKRRVIEEAPEKIFFVRIKRYLWKNSGTLLWKLQKGVCYWYFLSCRGGFFEAKGTACKVLCSCWRLISLLNGRWVKWVYNAWHQHPSFILINVYIFQTFSLNVFWTQHQLFTSTVAFGRKTIEVNNSFSFSSFVLKNNNVIRILHKTSIMKTMITTQD